MYVLDTCFLLWWTLDPEKLSPVAAKYCKNIDTEEACIASVSLWEIGVKIQKGKLNKKLRTAIFTRRGSALRIISVRRARKQEATLYG